MTRAGVARLRAKLAGRTRTSSVSPVACLAVGCPLACTMNALEKELAELMIGELNLEDIQLDSVSADTPLYGEGFALDSIDILEIALLVSKKYGFELRSGNPDNQKIFASLGSLAAYIAAHRVR
ncbi:acyl carrier protein [Ralstonia solanacearum]|uniref:Acyl carrier protein n=2 Tax=Ralstonia TaxID=48736 RepID=A0AB33VGA1_RALSU|nr:acyl carrier protein [Ralstonia solanacearum]EAP73854.1 Acyl carrier protein [Ralstonia solanacearum UW551]MBB6583271.1 PRK09184 family protein [Ralstonia solanacearum]NUU71541.1 PRK09184 family protein [Ralstonia solanacearum]OPK49274.1 acyl carrier protein [Ralstonia solanacearum]